MCKVFLISLNMQCAVVTPDDINAEFLKRTDGEVYIRAAFYRLCNAYNAVAVGKSQCEDKSAYELTAYISGNFKL